MKLADIPQLVTDLDIDAMMNRYPHNVVRPMVQVIANDFYPTPSVEAATWPDPGHYDLEF